jgi:hypothetical protein
MNSLKKEPIQFIQRKLQKNYRSITGHFPSVKNNKSIPFESKLESELFLTLEFDDEVESYLEQPQITITVDGVEKTYFVDCYVHMNDTSDQKDKIIEAKYVSDIEKDKEYYEKKFAAATVTVNNMGIDYLVYTDIVHSSKYIFNLDFLYRYISSSRITEYDKKILDVLGNKSITVKKITETLSNNRMEYAKVSNAIWGLVAHKYLITDLEQDLNMQSIVKVSQ